MNRKVLITGGANGIGKSIALAYAQNADEVIIADIDTQNGENLVEKITNKHGKASFIYCDVSRIEDIEHLFETIKHEYQSLNILINNAGISVWKSPLEIEVAEWDKIINTNLRSQFLCAREAAKIMKNMQRGSIINISSTRALMSEPNSEAYAASKGGIIALTHALAASLSAYKIQVNCISPGWIETGDYAALQGKDHAQHFAKRVGYPEDIASACLFLSAPDNNFISGTNLVIDGGMTKKMIYE